MPTKVGDPAAILLLFRQALSASPLSILTPKPNFRIDSRRALAPRWAQRRAM